MAKQEAKQSQGKQKSRRKMRRRSRKGHDESMEYVLGKPVSPVTVASLQNVLGNGRTQHLLAHQSQRKSRIVQADRKRGENQEADKAGAAIADGTGKAPADHDDLSAGLTAAEIALSVVSEVAPFIASAVATVAGAVVSAAGLLVTLHDANQRQWYYGKVVGTKLGLSVLGWLPSDAMPATITSEYLETQIKTRPDLLHQWVAQIQYAGASGPNLVINAMQQGLGKVATETSKALQAAEIRTLQKLQRSLSPQEAQARLTQTMDAVRQQVCQRIFEVAFQQLNSRFESIEESQTANPQEGKSDVSQKIQMIHALLDGWVSDDDLQAIRRICATNPDDLPAIRSAIEPRATELISFRQRTMLRRILNGA